MSDMPQPGTVPPSGAQAAPAHPPFPAVRLLYALLFGVLAYFAAMLVFALAVVQFIVLAITGKVNDELKSFSGNLVQYVWELLAFITFVRDDQPFPMGPFPRHH
ncbi:MAG TPA: DUF4389 domain-containing protein [Rhizomicrobium sp.]|nr:DUF4389 domain-containing protein [Rhizomicrobium sp.]